MGSKGGPKIGQYAKVANKDFVALFESLGPTKLSQKTGINVRSIMRRRERLEGAFGKQLTPPPHHSNTRFNVAHSARINVELKTGVALVGSDAHYWPGSVSTAHRAFVRFTKELEPKLVILNGDALDAATVSRHPPIGWESRPKLVDEIEECKERLSEIELACKRGTIRTWNLGNHDGRFETRLATVAPEYAKLHGVHLQDHFPLWEPAWSTWINNDVVVKHRFKGGIHAPHNNTMWAGKTIITGHLHSAKVIPLTDYNGTRYGVDTGCLADPNGKQFVDYTEDNPKNWRSAFGVLTFCNGRLMQPELVLVWDNNHVEFRGQLHKI